MKWLILDHFRRWWWVMVIVALLTALSGWHFASRPEITSITFLFMITMWSGGMLLIMDLKYNLARTTLSLPLTARQISRAWWVMTMPIPAAAMILCLLTGAGAFCLFHPGKVFPINQLMLACLFILSWGGVTAASSFITSIGLVHGSLRRVTSIMFSCLTVAVIFGSFFILANGTTQSLVKMTVYLGACVFIVIVSWFRAESSVVERAGFRLGGSRNRIPSKSLTSHASSGPNGISCLFFAMFTRTFQVGLVAFTFLAFGSVFARVSLGGFVSMTPWAVAVIAIAAMLAAQPLLFHMVCLRILPMSATRLTLIILASVILPFVSLIVLASGLAGLFFGFPDAVFILNGYILSVPIALCLALAIELGNGRFTLPVCFPVFFFMSMFMPQFNVLPWLSGTLVFVCLLLAFLSIRRALIQGRSIYKTPMIR